jgi:hypothetical protein
MARWSGFSYGIGNHKEMSVITASRVIDQQITVSNTLSTNSQQYNLLHQRVKTLQISPENNSSKTSLHNSNHTQKRKLIIYY